MTVNEIREKFLKYFEENRHKKLSSSSLVPNDDSVLLTTAGMQQFKKWFSNEEESPYSRVVTIQKCIRTNDINEVGDKEHLTFFEMLGNFSFCSVHGFYYKEEAIKFAWEFLTSKNWLNVDKNRIHATYFDQSKAHSGAAIIFETDNVSKRILENVDGLEKIKPQGDDNFWTLGIPGSPGGPTVEFYIDGVEVWNLVFNESIYTKDKNNNWFWPSLESELGVDTGMGLERLAATYNKLPSVYDTDELVQIVNDVRKLSQKSDTKTERIITDHLRAAVFMLADGIRPSNLDRGYILRRVIRRAIRYGKLVGVIEQNMCTTLAEKIIEIYSPIYKNLLTEKDSILAELNVEESKFLKVIDLGLEEIKKKKVLDGKEAFDLFSTKGMPLELSLEIAVEEHISVDENIQTDFDDEFQKHQEISRGGMEKKFAGGLENKEDPQVIRYHTTAHLLDAALREVLGEHVHQKGSNITSERVRFDFTHPEKMTDEEKSSVETLVNKWIEEKLDVYLQETDLDIAKKNGALGEFGQKYGQKVKVYTIGGPLESKKAISKEICGGPHVKNLAELGHFRIKKEESSSAGVRRIKGVLE